jgi:hypothetical protein
MACICSKKSPQSISPILIQSWMPRKCPWQILQKKKGKRRNIKQCLKFTTSKSQVTEESEKNLLYLAFPFLNRGSCRYFLPLAICLFSKGSFRIFIFFMVCFLCKKTLIISFNSTSSNSNKSLPQLYIMRQIISLSKRRKDSTGSCLFMQSN